MTMKENECTNGTKPDQDGALPNVVAGEDPADDRQVHLLGSFEPQRRGAMFLMFTGRWSWSDGYSIDTKFQWTEDYRLPEGFVDISIYVVDDLGCLAIGFYPTLLVFYSGGSSGSLATLAGAVQPRDYMEHEVNLEPCATASGAEFAKRGLSVFFPELPDW